MMSIPRSCFLLAPLCAALAGCSTLPAPAPAPTTPSALVAPPAGAPELEAVAASVSTVEASEAAAGLAELPSTTLGTDADALGLDWHVQLEPRWDLPSPAPERAAHASGAQLEQPVELRFDNVNAVLGAVAGAAPQDTVMADGNRKGLMRARAGLGMTASPTNFLLLIGAEYFVSDVVAVGPLMQFGLGDEFIFAPTFNVWGWFDPFAAEPEILSKLHPFVTFGIGLVHVDVDAPAGADDTATEFLLNFGGGVEYQITERIDVNSMLVFNVIPDGEGDDFFLSWQVVGGTFRF